MQVLAKNANQLTFLLKKYIIKAQRRKGDIMPMRKIAKIIVALATTAVLLLTNFTPAYGITNNTLLYNNAVHKIANNMVGWAPYGSGVIKISIPVYLSYFKGPSSFAPNSPSLYDETKWVEGGGFDEARYAAENPDVAAMVGTSHAALWNHFKTQGVLEGRIAHYKAVFNGYTWLNPWQHQEVEAICLAQESCNAGMSDSEKAIAINNIMCAKYSYSPTLENSRMTFTGTGICNDYADIYQSAMIALGIPCTKIIKNNHAWNEVYCDGACRVVDVTYNDQYGQKYLLSDYHQYD